MGTWLQKVDYTGGWNLALWLYERDVSQTGLYQSWMRWPTGESETVIVGLGLNQIEDAAPSEDGSCLSDDMTVVFIERWSDDKQPSSKWGMQLMFHVKNFDTKMAKSEVWRRTEGFCDTLCKLEKAGEYILIGFLALLGLGVLNLIGRACVAKCCPQCAEQQA